MSVFGDFQRVWVQRFPESALPAAWEEDVRANLAKHKQKVAILREELEKEEFYVEYLETLLSDVEKHKAAAQILRGAPPLGADVTESDDQNPDSKQVIHSNCCTCSLFLAIPLFIFCIHFQFELFLSCNVL